MVLGDLLVKSGIKIDAFGRLFLKIPNFENPSKTVVFPMYSMCCARTAVLQGRVEKQ